MAAPCTESMFLESESLNLAFSLRLCHETPLQSWPECLLSLLVPNCPFLLNPIPHTSISSISYLGWYMNI